MIESAVSKSQKRLKMVFHFRIVSNRVSQVIDNEVKVVLQSWAQKLHSAGKNADYGLETMLLGLLFRAMASELFQRIWDTQRRSK